MSEMQAHRLEQLYLKFRDKKSIHVLSTRPSVLYLLASNVDTKKIDSLAKGGKISVCGSYKTISQLTVKDISLLGYESKTQKSNRDNDEEEDQERDINRAKNAYRRLATLVEEINDWSNDLIRFREEKLEINKKELVKKYVKETIVCLKNLENVLS